MPRYLGQLFFVPRICMNCQLRTRNVLAILEYFQDMQDIEDHGDQQDKSAAAKEEMQQVPEEKADYAKEYDDDQRIATTQKTRLILIMERLTDIFILSLKPFDNSRH